MRVSLGLATAVMTMCLLVLCIAGPSECSCDQATFPQQDNICTKENMAIRREWGCFTDDEKLDYIRSVKCMMNETSSPSQIPAGVAPGAKSRYDDFLITHINMTFQVHVSGIFLPFHRRFLSLFETALRDECGYQGHLPYAYWPNYSANLTESSLFDGSPTSLGGDGYFNASNPTLNNGEYVPPESYGGGCVHTGPFANTTVHFRNFPPLGSINTLPADTTAYNPHCMKRNLNSAVAENSNNASDIRRLMNETNINTFLHKMDSVFFPDGTNIADYGTHAGFHAAVGGEMTDFFASVADPVFWLHHSMVDNLWTQWQAIDPPHRQYALNGTDHLLNPPNATTVTVDYELPFGYIDKPWKVGDLMDTTRGPYCYRYA